VLSRKNAIALLVGVNVEKCYSHNYTYIIVLLSAIACAVGVVMEILNGIDITMIEFICVTIALLIDYITVVEIEKERTRERCRRREIVEARERALTDLIKLLLGKQKGHIIKLLLQFIITGRLLH
jgi:hypothetical protein